MKVSYLIAALICALGLGLLIWGILSNAEVTLLGMTFHPRIARGKQQDKTVTFDTLPAKA